MRFTPGLADWARPRQIPSAMSGAVIWILREVGERKEERETD